MVNAGVESASLETVARPTDGAGCEVAYGEEVACDEVMKRLQQKQVSEKLNWEMAEVREATVNSWEKDEGGSDVANGL